MAVKIGSARIDENGHAHGGKAGDQTGNEVGTQNWYKHSKGWRVFRAKSKIAAEKIAQDMQYACNNSHIGYDQYQRSTLYSVSKPLGFNCSKVTTNTETDCSALVRVCCAYAGILLPDFNTVSEANALLNSGKFTEMKGSKYTDSSDYLERGDILVTKIKGHTVVVLSNGSKVTSAKPVETVDLSKADITGYIAVRHGNYYVRTEPSKNGEEIGIVHDGDNVPFLGVTKSGWNEVLFGSKVGWLSFKAGDIVSTNVKYLTVKAGNWYIRTEPTTTSQKVAVVSGGDRLIYTGDEQNGWYSVVYSGYSGWISKRGVV